MRRQVRPFSPVSSSLHGRTLALGATWGVLIGALARILVAPSSQASHGDPVPVGGAMSDPHEHLKSAVSQDTEDVCIQTYGSSHDWGQAVNKVLNALMGNSPVDWNGIASNDVFFSVPQCTGDTPFDILYWVLDETSTSCLADTSCAYGQHPLTYNKATKHFEYPRYIVYLKASQLNDRPNDVVNHETGHVLGLCDGGPSAPDFSNCHEHYPQTVWGQCQPSSIMHEYDCAFTDWPSASDRASVEALINGITGGGTDEPTGGSPPGKNLLG